MANLVVQLLTAPNQPRRTGNFLIKRQKKDHNFSWAWDKTKSEYSYRIKPSLLNRSQSFVFQHEHSFTHMKVWGLRQQEPARGHTARPLSNMSQREVWDRFRTDSLLVPDPWQTSPLLISNLSVDGETWVP